MALTDLSYDYGPDAQLTAILDNLDPTKSKAIAYDDLNRLVQVSEGVPVAQGGVPVPVEDYAYDEEGNRLSSHLSVLYSSNAHNQLLEDDEFTYAYDAKGNRVSKTSKLDGSVETYSYDSQNRLVGYASDDVTASYAYDPLDRRIAKTVDGETKVLIYDTDLRTGLRNDDIVLEFESGLDTVLRTRWLHTNHVDEVIGREIYSSNATPGAGVTGEIFSDRQRSVSIVLSASSGETSGRIEYDAFGVPSSIGANLDSSFLFNGREFDQETGLYFHRTRYYDANTGRFLQVDPIEFWSGTANIYEYAENNPFMLSDPSGLYGASTADFIKAAGAAGLGIVALSTPNSEGDTLLGGIISLSVATMKKLDAMRIASSLESMNPPGGGKDPCRGLRFQLREHQKKLQDYLSEPFAGDNKDLLKNAQHPIATMTIIFGRVASIVSEIETIKRNIRKCERDNGMR